MNAVLYALPNLIATTLFIVFALYAWLHRKVPAASIFAAWMLVGAGWAFTFAMTTLMPDLPSKIAWGNARFLFVPWIGVFGLFFVLRFLGKDRWLRWPWIVAVSIIPAITTILSLTTQLHGWFRFNQHIDPSGLNPFLISSPGPWFWVHLVTSEAILLLDIILLVWAFPHSPRYFRRQVALVALAIAIPVVYETLYSFFGIAPLPGYNLTATLLVVSGALIALAIFRFRMLDLVPIAREQLVESMQDPVLAIDEAERLVDCNRAAQRVFALNRAKSLGQPASQLLPVDINISLWGSPGESREVRFAVENQERVWELSQWPIQDRRGHRLGRVLVWREITRRKQAEISLRESEARFHELADRLPQPIYELDRDRRFTYLNQAGFDQAGYTAEDLEGGLVLSQLFSSEEQGKAASNFQQLLAGELPTQPREYTLCRKDGSTFPAMVYSVPILKEGISIGIRGFMIDISERKRSEQLQADMIRAVVHDLSNPIASIQITLESLLPETPFPKREEYLAIARNNTERLQRLASNLLEAARIEAGELILQQERLDLGTLLANLARMIQPLAEEKALHFLLQTTSAALYVLGDRTRLEQAFSNLWANAIKFSPRGGTIRTQLLKNYDRILVVIEDNGPGIAACDLPHIFERFYRGSTRLGGSGLGLFVAKWILQAHSGKIEVTSQVAEGSRFQVWLPLADQTGEAAGSTEQPEIAKT